MTFQEVYNEVTYKEPVDIPNDGDWCSISENTVARNADYGKNKNYNTWDNNHRNLIAEINHLYYNQIECETYTRPKKVRCPKCGRYLTPKVIDYEPGYSFEPGLRFPPHKVKPKDRIKNQKARKKAGDKGYVR